MGQHLLWRKARAVAVGFAVAAVALAVMGHLVVALIVLAVGPAALGIAWLVDRSERSSDPEDPGHGEGSINWANRRWRSFRQRRPTVAKVIAFLAAGALIAAATWVHGSRIAGWLGTESLDRHPEHPLAVAFTPHVDSAPEADWPRGHAPELQMYAQH